MIAIDTSALIAILLEEPHADACSAALADADRMLISAGTLAELLIVAMARNVREEALDLIDRLGIDVISVTPAIARRIGSIYEKWGKGRHRAGLNYGDCFAYVLAKDYGCPLLYVGDDFARTDLVAAL